MPQVCQDVEGDDGVESSEELEREEKKEITDLAMLLRSEREKEQKGQVSAPEPSVSNYAFAYLNLVYSNCYFCCQDEPEDSDKITAYKSELEYLDDHFQVCAFTL